MSRTSRKLEHVEYALKTGQSGEHGLSDVRFVHNCIPETATKAVRLDTTIGEFEMNSPIIINAMTGGAEETAKLNEQFALLAAETGLTMAVGSQMSAVKNPEWTHTYRIARGSESRRIDLCQHRFGSVGGAGATRGRHA